MFIVTVNSIDRSRHTQECDAIVQKQRFIDLGISEATISIVEKETYQPTQPE